MLWSNSLIESTEREAFAPCSESDLNPVVQQATHSIFLADKGLLEHKARQKQLYVLYCLPQGDTESGIRHYYCLLCWY